MVQDYGKIASDLGRQLQRWVTGGPKRATASGPSLPDLVAEAHREWVLALRYFDSVDDPELVEHAAYLVKAAERRYMYLVKEARRQGLTIDAPPLPDA
jgi:hypothetical protein